MRNAYPKKMMALAIIVGLLTIGFSTWRSHAQAEDSATADASEPRKPVRLFRFFERAGEHIIRSMGEETAVLHISRAAGPLGSDLNLNGAAEGVFYLALYFPPSRPLIISKETTFITEPLAEDGFPDYFAHVRKQFRQGVTIENNAAVPLVKAVGLRDIPEEIRDAWFQELGIEPLPEEGEYLSDIDDELSENEGVAWLVKQLQANAPKVQEQDEELTEEEIAEEEDSEDDEDSEEWFSKITEEDLAEMSPEIREAILALRRGDGGRQPLTDEEEIQQQAEEMFFDLNILSTGQAWTSESFPYLAKWMAANQRPLDLAVEASRRSKYYGPMIREGSPALLSLQLPLTTNSMGVARGLARRAMGHLGEGRFEQAQADILAIHKLAHLVGEPPGTLIDLLVGLAIDGIACTAHVALISDPKTPPEVLKKSLRELRALPRWEFTATVFNDFERLSSLETILSIRRNPDSLNNLVVGGRASSMSFLAAVVDWNHVIREFNLDFDFVVAALRASGEDVPGEDRSDLIMNSHLSKDEMRWEMAKGVFSRRMRSDLMLNIFRALLFPAISSIPAAEREENVRVDMTATAAALALYRVENGEYPEQLEALVPEFLDEVAEDVLADKPLSYRRLDDGYLLYSVGRDGRDSGGSNAESSIHKGKRIPDDSEDNESDEDEEEDYWDSDDEVILMPIPRLKIEF